VGSQPLDGGRAQPIRASTAAILVALVTSCDAAPPQTVQESGVYPDEVYQNPLDGMTYVAPGGWKTHLPRTPRPDQEGQKVKPERVRLLTSDADILARTTVEDLTILIREAESLADVTLGHSDKRFQIMVQFTCKPSGHEIRLAHHGDATPEILQAYFDALSAAKNLPVKEGEVSFQIELSVDP